MKIICDGGRKVQKIENNKEVMSMPQAMPENRTPYAGSMAKPMMEYQTMYPEIFYKLQPYVMMVCDQMDYSSIMPNMEMVQNMTDNIFDDVCRMYPDLVEYVRNNENDEAAIPTFNHNPDRRRFRRRGLFRDIIDILILSELFGRRRRFF